MLVRFVRPNFVDGMAAREGFFCAAYELREDTLIDPYTSDQLEQLLSWFRKELPIPRNFARSRSKGSGVNCGNGLSWFKPEATAAIAKSYELIGLLDQNGYHIELLRTDRAGFVVYEDDFQLVAEPFSDTPI